MCCSVILRRCMAMLLGCGVALLPARPVDLRARGEDVVEYPGKVACPSGRRCSTRNAVWCKPPRVRIPALPPSIPVMQCVAGFFVSDSDARQGVADHDHQLVQFLRPRTWWCFMYTSSYGKTFTCLIQVRKAPLKLR